MVYSTHTVHNLVQCRWRKLVIKKLIAVVVVLAQLIAQTGFAQTFKVNNLNVTGTSTFASRPTFNSNTPYDTGNLTIANYATLASPVFTGTPTVPGYLTTVVAASTYAPLASPTFTGTGTIPSGWTIGGYLTSSTAAATYAPLAGPTFTGVVATSGSFSGLGTSLSGTATSLSIGGNATTATTATNLAGGAANRIPFQTAAGTTSFVAAPTTSGTCAQWNGSSIVWATCGSGGGGSGTVTSVAASGGTTGLTYSGSPVTTSGTLTTAGTLVSANGGTGVVSPTAHGVVVAEGASPMAVATVGTAGNVLMDQGSGNDPKFQSLGSFFLTGADPTGVTDSTTAIQNAVNTAVVNGLELDIPPGTYKISSHINIPFGTGWSIKGFARGGTVISQATNNTPIWYFNTGSGGTGPYDWQITDLTLAYASSQPATNTQAIPFFFTNADNTYFDFQIQRITFQNCFEGIAEDSTSPPTVWGMAARDNTYGSTNTGGFLNLSYAGAGQPNIEVDGVYVTASAIVSTESVINVANNDSGWFTHIEINGVNNGSTLMTLSGAAAIGSIKVEVATYGNGQEVFVFPNAHITIGTLNMDTLTIAATGGAAYGIDGNAGGGSTTLVIGQTNLSFNTVSGNFYLLNGGTAPAFSVRFLSAPYGLLGAPAGVFLTQVPAAIGSNGVSIDDWQQNRLSADSGDANATYSVGNPNTILYNTPLTATRTVTFTDAYSNSSDSNLYNGLKVCVLRTPNATGTGYGLTIKNSGGSTIGTFGNGLFGKMCFMWQRALNGWVITDNQAWTGTALP
jgi:hypothetical protein